MRQPLMPCLLLLWACTGPTAAPPPPAAAERPWQAAMAEIGRQWQVLEAELKARPHGDLRRAAQAAEVAAAQMQHGYRDLVDPRIEGFATMAHAAESWLLRIAMEARLDHPDLAAALLREGEALHCSRCHEAARPFFAW